MAEPESTFATIRDVRDRLSELVERGLGDLPTQILIVPDSTLQAIARNSGPDGYDNSRKPALMIDLEGDGVRMPVCITTVERISSNRTTQ